MLATREDVERLEPEKPSQYWLKVMKGIGLLIGSFLLCTFLFGIILWSLFGTSLFTLMTIGMVFSGIIFFGMLVLGENVVGLLGKRIRTRVELQHFYLKTVAHHKIWHEASRYHQYLRTREELGFRTSTEVDGFPLKTYLTGYAWIRIPRYEEDEKLAWETRYHKLEEHHQLETDFLIRKARRLAKIAVDADDDAVAKLEHILRDVYREDNIHSMKNALRSIAEKNGFDIDKED